MLTAFWCSTKTRYCLQSTFQPSIMTDHQIRRKKGKIDSYNKEQKKKEKTVDLGLEKIVERKGKLRSFMF